MNKATKARKHNSPKLKDLLDEVTPLEMEQAKVKMQLAARIEDFMKIKGWNKSQFAEKVGKTHLKKQSGLVEHKILQLISLQK